MIKTTQRVLHFSKLKIRGFIDAKGGPERASRNKKILSQFQEQ